MAEFRPSGLFNGHRRVAFLAFLAVVGLIGLGFLLSVVMGGTNKGRSSNENPCGHPNHPACTTTTASTSTTTTTTPTTTTTTTTPPTGYTSVASVDTSRMPIPPQSSTVINLTAPITISTTVSDVTYNVTGPISGPAIWLTATGKLVRVIVKVNELADDGVAGTSAAVGAVQDVAVYDAKYAGFIHVLTFTGADYGQHNYVDFNLGGTGVTIAPDAMLKSYDTVNFGIYCEHLYDSHLDGALVALSGGLTNRNTSATGIVLWNDCQRNAYNVVIGNAMPGYALQIAGGSAFNTFHDVGGSDTGAFDSDPGISFEGGAHDNTITNATMNAYIVGAMLGEDVDPEVYNNRIDTLTVSDAAYAGVELDRGAYNNTIGSVGGTTLTNCGGTSTLFPGAVTIQNRSGQTNVPPHGNQVLGVNEGGTARVPVDGIYLGTGTSGNTVSGTVTSWSSSKVVDLGTGNMIAV